MPANSLTTMSLPDPNPNPPEKKMKVLVLGLCRTGTQSIATALETLGFTPIYHMKEIYQNKHQDSWIRAMEAKFEGKGEWGKEEWWGLLGGWEVSFLVLSLLSSFCYGVFLGCLGERGFRVER